MNTIIFKNLLIGTFTIVLMVFLSSSCKKEDDKIDNGKNELLNCLKIAPKSYEWLGYDVNFNERWIAQKKVKKIIERIFKRDDDDDEYRLYQYKVFHFNDDGYIKSKYGKYNYPKDTLAPIENTIRSKRNYRYEKSDSLLFQHTETISFFDRENNRLAVPDTAKHNFTEAYALKDVNTNEQAYRLICRSPYTCNRVSVNYNGLFKYDEKGRMTYCPDGNVDYLDDRTVRIKKSCYPDIYSHMPPICNFILKSNEKGQIVEHSVENGAIIVSFKYNDDGALIKKEGIKNINGISSTPVMPG